MKKYIYSVLAIAFLFLSCNENMPGIACLTCGEETECEDLLIQNKNILIEKFTGVECIGCPRGSEEIENMLSIFGEQLIAVYIHASPLATPYPESQYDFRTEEGEFLMSYLGLPNGLPSAVINRKSYNGNPDLQLVGHSSWAGIVDSQTSELAKVAMVLENDYDSNNRQLSIKVNGKAHENIEEVVRLTVMITESGIMDAQLTPESSPERDLDYVHKRILRKVVSTNFDGDEISPVMFDGDLFEESYTVTLPAEWNAAKCKVIAFTHLSESSKEVLQVFEKAITE